LVRGNRDLYQCGNRGGGLRGQSSVKGGEGRPESHASEYFLLGSAVQMIRTPLEKFAAGSKVLPSSTGDAAFRLVSSSRSVVAKGIRRELVRGSADTLAARAQSFFVGLADGPRYLVGAMPFDREKPDYLFQPERLSFDADAVTGSPARAAQVNGGRWMVEARPEAAQYSDAVAKCLALMADTEGKAEPVSKVVLSRSLTAVSRQPVDPALLVKVLGHDPSVTVFSTPLPAASSCAPRLLVGATPELLVSKSGATVLSHPLAGSARRSGDPAADRESAMALETSEKNRREHLAVVESILDILAPYCSDLKSPEGTTLRPTETMWHLGTRIVGTLKDRDTPVVELAGALHPTPAVCGLPRERAASIIADLEDYDRDFYAGAVGWTDGAGDGEWYVSIRCAEVAGTRIRLYAGAGIVAGSSPFEETEETSAKFIAMLSALGIDEKGRPLRGHAA